MSQCYEFVDGILEENVCFPRKHEYKNGISRMAEVMRMSAEKKLTKTKEKVLDAAIDLFNSQGFNGTSVRDIANKAGVNVSLISYYFNGKKGLLEYLMTSFLEEYLRIMEESYQKQENSAAKERLLDLVYSILQYESSCYQLARFTHREITLDSLLVREIMMTYLAKETHYYRTIIEKGIANGEFRKKPVMLTVMQIKGMLTMPFIHPQYLVEVLHLRPNERYFVDIYFKEIQSWINEDLCVNNKKKIPLTRSFNHMNELGRAKYLLEYKL